MPKKSWIKLMNSINGSKLVEKQDEQILFLTHPESTSQVISVARMTRLKNSNTAQVVDDNDCEENFETGLPQISNVLSIDRRQMELKDCNSKIRSTVHLLKQTARVDLYRERIQERAKQEDVLRKHHEYYTETYSRVKGRFSREDAKEFDLYHSRIDSKSFNFMPLNVGRPPNINTSSKSPMGVQELRPLEVPKQIKPKLNSPKKRFGKVEESWQEMNEASPILISRDVNGQIRVHLDCVRLDHAKAEDLAELNGQYQERLSSTKTSSSAKKQNFSLERKLKVDNEGGFSDQIEAKKVTFSHQIEQPKTRHRSPEKVQILKIFPIEDEKQIDDFKPYKYLPAKGQTKRDQIAPNVPKFPSPSVKKAVPVERSVKSPTKKVEPPKPSCEELPKTENDRSFYALESNLDTYESTDKIKERSKEKVLDHIDTTLTEVSKSNASNLTEVVGREESFTHSDLEDNTAVNFLTTDETNMFSNVKNDHNGETKTTPPRVTTNEVNNELIATNTDVFVAFSSKDKISEKEKSNIKVDENNVESNSSNCEAHQISEGRLIRSNSEPNDEILTSNDVKIESETPKQPAESYDNGVLESETRNEDDEKIDDQNTAEQSVKKANVANDHKMTSRRKSRHLSPVKILGPKGDRKQMVVDITGTYVASNLPTSKTNAPSHKETLPSIIARPKPKFNLPEPKMSVDNLRKSILSSGEGRKENINGQFEKEELLSELSSKTNSAISQEKNHGPRSKGSEKEKSVVFKDQLPFRKSSTKVGNLNTVTHVKENSAGNTKLSNGKLSNASSGILNRRSIHFDKTVRPSSLSPSKQPKTEVHKEKAEVGPKTSNDKRTTSIGQSNEKKASENLDYGAKLVEKPQKARNEFEKSSSLQSVANTGPKITGHVSVKTDSCNEIIGSDQNNVPNSSFFKCLVDAIDSNAENDQNLNSNNHRLPRLSSAISSISNISCDTVVDANEAEPQFDLKETRTRDDKMLSHRGEIIQAKTPISTPVSDKNQKVAVVKVSSTFSQQKPTNENSHIKRHTRQASVQSVVRPVKEPIPHKKPDYSSVPLNLSKTQQPVLETRNDKSLVQPAKFSKNGVNGLTNVGAAINGNHVGTYIQSKDKINGFGTMKTVSRSGNSPKPKIFSDQHSLTDVSNNEGSTDVREGVKEKVELSQIDVNCEKDTSAHHTPRNNMSNVNFEISGLSSDVPLSNITPNGQVSGQIFEKTVCDNSPVPHKLLASRKYEAPKPVTRSKSDQTLSNIDSKAKSNSSKTSTVNYPPTLKVNKNSTKNIEPLATSEQDSSSNAKAKVPTIPRPISGQKRKKISVVEPQKEDPPKKVRSLVHDQSQKPWRNAMAKPSVTSANETEPASSKESSQLSLKRSKSRLSLDSSTKNEDTKDNTDPKDGIIADTGSSKTEEVDSTTISEETRKSYWSTIYNFLFQRKSNNFKSSNQNNVAVNREMTKIEEEHDETKENEKVLNQKQQVPSLRRVQIAEKSLTEQSQSTGGPSGVRKSTRLKDTADEREAAHDKTASDVQKQSKDEQEHATRKLTVPNSNAVSDGHGRNTKSDLEKSNRKLGVANLTESPGNVPPNTKLAREKSNRKLSSGISSVSDGQDPNAKAEQELSDRKVSITNSATSTEQVPSMKTEQEKTNPKFNRTNSSVSYSTIAPVSNDPSKVAPSGIDPVSKSDIQASQQEKRKKKSKESKKVETVADPVEIVPEIHPNMMKIEDEVEPPKQEKKRSFWDKVKSAVFGGTIEDDSGDEDEDISIPDLSANEEAEFKPRPIRINIISAVQPSNISEERVRFFNADFNYEPQFTYQHPCPPEVLRRCSEPCTKYLKIVKSAVFGCTIEDDSGDEDEDISIPDLSANEEAEFKPRPIRINIISAVQPSNISEERVKFFNADFNYEPQFTYQHPCPTEVLQRYLEPCTKYLKIAEKILNDMLRNYGTYDNFEQKNLGDEMKRYELVSYVDAYCSREGIRPHDIMINISSDLLSTASMGKLNNYGVLSLKLGSIYKGTIEGILRHELGTHYIRRFNNNLQPWSEDKDRHKYRMLPMNPTEEGLASLHSVILRPQPMLYKIALLYYTVVLASMMSFSDLFKTLGGVLRNPHRRWEFCMRAKRGQIDTSQPGCFIKDQVYLTGAIDILRHRKEIDFKALVQLGKVAFEDVNRLKKLANKDEVFIVPSFMHDREEYMNRLEYIMAKNGLKESDFETISNTTEEEESDRSKTRSRFDL